MPGPDGGVRVALDAMGGDAAPAATVAGALLAAADGVEVVLVGRPAVLAGVLAAAGRPGALPIVPAGEVVGMDEDPAVALHRKRDASIRVATQLLADGAVDAVVSAGSTGATLAAALLVVGRVPGVRRPVVAAALPAAGDRPVVLADAGGSADVAAEALVTHARMAVAYADVLAPPGDVAERRFGLLNVGAERGKGNALARGAYALLTGTRGFAGNVEPAAVLAGAVDAVVTDGFTGNIFLKALEAAAAVAAPERARTAGHDRAAVLLGVAGEVLVAHGDAAPDDVAAALRTARRVAAAGLSRRVADRLAVVPAAVHP